MKKVKEEGKIRPDSRARRQLLSTKVVVTSKVVHAKEVVEKEVAETHLLEEELKRLRARNAKAENGKSVKPVRGAGPAKRAVSDPVPSVLVSEPVQRATSEPVASLKESKVKESDAAGTGEAPERDESGSGVERPLTPETGAPVESVGTRVCESNRAQESDQGGGGVGVRG